MYLFHGSLLGITKRVKNVTFLARTVGLQIVCINDASFYVKGNTFVDVCAQAVVFLASLSEETWISLSLSHLRRPSRIICSPGRHKQPIL